MRANAGMVVSVTLPVPRRTTATFDPPRRPTNVLPGDGRGPARGRLRQGVVPARHRRAALAGARDQPRPGCRRGGGRPGGRRHRLADGGGVPPRRAGRGRDDARAARPVLRAPQARHRRWLQRGRGHPRADRPGEHPLPVRRHRAARPGAVPDDVERLRRDRRPQQPERRRRAARGTDRGGRPRMPGGRLAGRRHRPRRRPSPTTTGLPSAADHRRTPGAGDS